MWVSYWGTHRWNLGLLASIPFLRALSHTGPNFEKGCAPVKPGDSKETLIPTNFAFSLLKSWFLWFSDNRKRFLWNDCSYQKSLSWMVCMWSIAPCWIKWMFNSATGFILLVLTEIICKFYSEWPLALHKRAWLNCYLKILNGSVVQQGDSCDTLGTTQLLC